MTRAADWVGQGRGFLARLFAVAAVVAALMVMLVPLCGDGMLAGTPMAPVVASTGDPASGPRHDVQPLLPMAGGPCATVVGSSAHNCGSDVHAATGAAVPDQPGGALLAACLAIFAAVLVMAFGLWRPRPIRVAAPSVSLRWPVVYGCPARRPSLAELCVLRT